MGGVAKTVNFGVIYGMSAFGLADRLEIPKEDAIRFIDTFFAEHPRVLEYQNRLLAKCREDGYVSTILGRRRAISGIRGSTSYKNRNQPEREAINMEIQGSISSRRRCCGSIAGSAETSAAMLLQIHDELVFEALAGGSRERVVAIIREEDGGCPRRLDRGAARRRRLRGAELAGCEIVSCIATSSQDVEKSRPRIEHG